VRWPFRPVLSVCLPASVPSAVRQPLLAAAVKAGASQAWLLSPTLAGALGAGVDLARQPARAVVHAHLGGLEMAVLEGGEWALVCGSGMAALSAILLATLQQGGRVVASDQLYGRTTQLLQQELGRFGVQTTFVDTNALEEVRGALRTPARVLLADRELLREPLWPAFVPGLGCACWDSLQGVHLRSLWLKHFHPAFRPLAPVPSTSYSPLAKCRTVSKITCSGVGSMSSVPST